jgi:hypothetical protein
MGRAMLDGTDKKLVAITVYCLVFWRRKSLVYWLFFDLKPGENLLFF